MSRGRVPFGRSALPLTVLLSLAAVLAPDTGKGQEIRRLSGSQVAIYNLAGTAQIVPGTGSEVVVEIRTRGDEGSRLEMEVRDIEGREALVVKYPEDRVLYPEMGRGSNTRVRVRGDGSFFGGWNLMRGREVRISGSGNGMEAWADLRISVPSERDLALFLAAGETTMEGVDADVRLDTGTGAVRVFESKGQLMVDTGSGEVRVEAFQGNLNVDTGSGGVDLVGIQGEDVVVDTGSGSVSGTDIMAGALEIDTGSGTIRLRGVSAPRMTLDTGSGSVEVELEADVDEVEIDTGSGSVTVQVPATLGAGVVLDTGSGGVDVGVPFEATKVERGHVEGTLGDGRGRIRIDTGSGRIRIQGG